MYNRKASAFTRFMIMILIVAMTVPMGVSAATGEIAQPYASYYLNSYNAYVYPAGGGDVQVWFSATGAGTMDELGALTIEIHESTDGDNFTWVDTFNHDSTSGMLGYGTNLHSGHVTYDGVAGRYYKAYVCIWGGKNGVGDTRYFWTSAKKAT